MSELPSGAKDLMQFVISDTLLECFAGWDESDQGQVESALISVFKQGFEAGWRGCAVRCQSLISEELGDE